MELTITGIRRYPVKAMAGESLETVELDHRGLLGDRWYAVTDKDGKLASGKDGSRFRRHDAVFDYAAHTHDESVWVVGPAGTWRVGQPELNDELSQVFGAPVEVKAESGVPHYDGGAVSIIGSATLKWMAQQWGINADARRLRANLVLDTQEPFVEETWVGQQLEIGSSLGSGVRMVIERRIPRCRTVDIDQDGASAEGRLLRLLGRHRELCAAVYARVAAPGSISEGDSARVSEPTASV